MKNYQFAEAFMQRTSQFAVRILLLTKSMSKSTENQVIARQLAKCGTSVAANYRAACRSRSRAEFVSKLCIVLEESDETVFWLELLDQAKIYNHERLSPLIQEAKEIRAIVAKARKTLKNQSHRNS